MSENQEPNPTNPIDGTAAPSKYTFMADLKSDGKTIGNQAVWNMALMVPFYMYKVDEMIFQSKDSDFVAGIKLGGLIAGVSGGQKLIRKTLVQAGVSSKVAYPFGML